MTQWFSNLISTYFSGFYFPRITLIDVLEVIILTFVIYQIVAWIMNTKAWMLMRVILVVAIFFLIAVILQMNPILFIARNLLTVFAIAVVVVFQPELRRGLEKLGEQSFIPSASTFEPRDKARFSDETIDSIVEACFDMGRVKTGALIVVEQAIKLTEYEDTGIHMDCVVSMQVLCNIFEKNTPLHDGAVIIRGDRIVSATCYLPLSDNMDIAKDLGTRHRAALGMSEVSDALVIVVSEETGAVSIARDGNLTLDISEDELRGALEEIQYQKKEKSSRRWPFGRSGKTSEKQETEQQEAGQQETGQTKVKEQADERTTDA